MQFGLFRRLLMLQVVESCKESRLGVVWLLIQPLITLLVYVFVFSIIFQARWSESYASTGDFALQMFCGLAVFRLMSEGVLSSALCICNNPAYVKKIVFPLELLPCVQVGAVALVGIGWFVLLAGAAVLLTGSLSVMWLWLPVLLLPVLLLSTGLALLAASMTVFVRDIQPFLQAVFQILFFATPVIYPLERVPAPYASFLAMNPMTGCIELVRNVLLGGAAPDPFLYGKLLLIAVFTLGVALFVFRRLKRGFADVM